MSVSKKRRSAFSSGPKRLKRNLGLLKIISATRPCDHKTISNSLHNDYIRCLSDCSHNILNGNVKLSTNEKMHLKPFAKAMRQLAKRELPISTKKKLIVKQKGGFLGFLVKPVLSLLGGLLGGSTGSI